MKYLKIFDGLLPRISIIAFILLTFIYSISRVPFFDEAYAYLISNLKLSEIFCLTRIEGHPILWYFLLKITDFSYPYSMLILNWLIAAVMIVFFWKKAPFNNFVKFLITFSYPFFNYFAVVARPYGLTVLAIFLLCYFYKSAVLKPVLFSFLLIFCSNTSVMGMIGAFSFFCIFMFDIYKNREKIDKKTFFIIFVIFLFGALFLCSQFINLQMPHYRPIFNNVLIYFVNPLKGNLIRTIVYFVSCGLIISTLFVLFKRCKKAFWFLLLSYFSMLVLFLKIYPGGPWHYFFFIIFLIAAFWISYEKIKDVKFLNIIFALFLIFTLNPHNFFENGKYKLLDTSNYKTILNKIMENEELKNSKLFCFDWYSPVSPGILPYLKKENIKIFDSKGYDRTTLESFKLTSYYFLVSFNPDELVKYLDKTKNNYLLSGENLEALVKPKDKNQKLKRGDIFTSKGKDSKIIFELVEHYPEIPFSVFKINHE